MAILSLVVAWTGVVGLAAGDDQTDRAFDQAKHALKHGDYDGVVARLDEALRLAPNEAKLLGLRGVARLFKGESAKGLADLQVAIKRNPGDAGIGYQPSGRAKFSKEAFRHGQQQVARMLRDRPAMAQFSPETEFLRHWATQKFAGEDFGEPIDWDPSPPLHSDAEHLAPEDDENAAILVAAVYDSGPDVGKPRTFEELWAGAVYELHNVNFAREFIRLYDEADEGKISKRDFVADILKYELRAAQETRAFYVQVFLPWVAKNKLPTDPTLWFCDWWDTPEGVLQSFVDPAAYPWRPYARTHDWATIHRYWRQGDFSRAIKLLGQMRLEEGYEDEQDDVDHWIDSCRGRLKENQENK